MASGKGSAKGLQLVRTDDVNTIHHPSPSTKTVIIQPSGNGFGFTLRHFVIYPPELVRLNPQEGVVNGLDQRDHGEAKRKPMDTVFVRQVAPGGPADKSGLCTGDQIVSVNGSQVLNRTYSQVIELIQKSRDQVELGIIPKEECVLEMVNPASPVPTSPPPTKPKPARSTSTSSSVGATGNVTSSVMIATTPSPDVQWKNSSSVMLKLNDRPTDSYVPRGSDTHVTRRGSVDRTMQIEHRNFVITSESNGEEDSNNNKHKQPSSPKQNTVQSPMDGTFFFATTDYTGKPKALHFQRGAAVGDKLMVYEDPKAKGRSRSLSAVEMEGFRGWQDNRNHPYPALPQQCDQQRDQGALQINIGEHKISDSSASSIPQFSLSAPRIIASDSPSTTNISTNSDFSSRQPIAREPVHRRMSGEESSSYLIRTIASHMNQDRSPGNLKSSTMEATLLESKPDDHWHNDEPQPAKIPRSDRHESQSYSTQVSVYPSQTPEGVSLQLNNASGGRPSEFRLETPIVHEPETSTSPRHRRTSYLMATGSGPTSPPGPNSWSSQSSSVKKKKPTLSSAFSSSFITPMMIHVSSGTEVCHDVPKDEFMENDEIFMEGERDEDSLVPRLGRRVSYVMATSTPSSPTSLTLEGMKEEDEGQAPGNGMEISKEGLLWKKLAAAGGGKRSSVRSWKPVHVVLRGHIMYFHKDKETARQGEGGEESQPISIKSSIVDIAHDYTKRKNVFRMTTFNGSEFLFQAEDHESMMTWIAVIQANNNPDEDVSGVTSQSVIIRRMRNVEQESTGNAQTPPVHKLTPVTGAKMPNFSNLKKSLSFKNISGSQKGDSGKNHQWGKSHKKRKKPPTTTANFTPGHSIGVPLEMCPYSQFNKFIPIVVKHCCEVVEQKGIDTVGVYRVPGNSAAVGALQEELNERGAENINFQEEKWHDVNNITSLLKMFLRKLPEGLVTAELYDSFIEANRKEDPVDRMGALKILINELPDHNYETLRYLLSHLKSVSENSDVNKMEARNIAIVFGPTLVRTGEDTMMSMVKDMSDQCRIVETILNHNEWFFESSEGEDAPPSKPPIDTDSPHDQFISQSVLSSLGQAVGNFNEEGNIRSKLVLPSNLTLPIPKFRGHKSKSESHDPSAADGALSDGSVSPTTGRPVVKITSAGSCPGSPTSERSNKISAARRAGELASSSTGSMTEAVELDSRPRGTSSLRAYSYARPPPPSYRKMGSAKRPNSPSTPEEPLQVSATFGIAAPDHGDSSRTEGDQHTDLEHGSHVSKPSFASLSEETRLRLLKVSLQQRAAEKKRTIESPTSPTPPSFPTETNGEVSTYSLAIPHRPHEQDASDSTEHLSGSDTSQSSSTPSSKNASRESLQQQTEQPETRKHMGNVAMKAATWERRCSAGRVNTQMTPPHAPHTATPHAGTSAASHTGNLAHSQGSTTQPQASSTLPHPQASSTLSHPHGSSTLPPSHGSSALSSSQGKGSSPKVESSETVLNIVQGKGVSTAEATRRPMSSDIRARRNTAEGLRLPPSFHSESSSSSSDEEGDLKLSMSKTFDEKLRILLDLDYQFKGQKKKEEEEEEAASVSSFVRSSTESLEDMHGSNTSLTSSASDRRPSFERSIAEPRRPSVERSQFIINNKQSVASSNRTSIQINPTDRRGSASTGRTQERSSDARPVSTKDVSKSELTVDKNVPFRKSEGSFPSDHPGSSSMQSKIGRVHTSTPVALKEFKLGQPNVRKDQYSSGRRVAGGSAPFRGSAPSNRSSVNTPPKKPALTRHDSPYIKSKTDSTFVKPRTETTSILISPRNSTGSPRGSISSPRGSVSDSSPRNSSAESSPRNSRTEMNINLSTSGQQKGEAVPTAGSRKPTASKYAAMAARAHVPPKVMGRESASKPKAYTYRDSHRDILPSRNLPLKEPIRQKHVHKLESNAKHIAELLEEMHSERYFKMSRQRSDISGQAQRNAALRAAQARTRRRSLGDENADNLRTEVSAGHDKERTADKVDNVPQGSHYSAQRKESGERRDSRKTSSRDNRTKAKTSR